MDWIFVALVAGIIVFVVGGVVLGTWLTEKLGRWLAEEGGEEPDIDPPTVQLRKIEVPTFGLPEVAKYDPSLFLIPLVCAAPNCQKALRQGDDYYEIPIPNGEPGSVTAVHVGCVLDEMAHPIPEHR